MEIDVAPDQARALLESGSVQLVDVRETYEYDAGRIAGSRLIGLANLSAEAETIDRERPVLFYCAVGSRSTMAAQAFRASGYDAYSLAGGLVAWQLAGQPLEPEDGSVAGH